MPPYSMEPIGGGMRQCISVETTRWSPPLAWYVLAPHIDLIKLGLDGLLTEPIWPVVLVLIWYAWV